jgi:hypothetical protein
VTSHRGRRLFEVRASYLGRAIERSASVRAETPEQAAALAIWRGYLPLCFENHGERSEVGDSGPRPVYWDPAARPLRHWPEPVATLWLSEDHACVRLTTGDAETPTVLVEAKALA